MSGTAGPRDLPGFYYDPDRRKYFRIRPNHHATPSSSLAGSTSGASNATIAKYTKQAVQTEQLHSREARIYHSKAERKRAENVRRSQFFTHPIHRLDLSVRLGDRKSAGDDIRKQYAWILRRNVVMKAGNPRSKFAVEEGSKALFTTAEVESRGGRGMREMCVTPLSLNQGDDEPVADSEELRPRYDPAKTIPVLNAPDAEVVLPLSERLVIWSIFRGDNTQGGRSELCFSSKYAEDNVPWQNWREEFGEWGTTVLQVESLIWDIAVPRQSAGGAVTPRHMVMATSGGTKICEFDNGARGVSVVRTLETTGDHGMVEQAMAVRFKDENVFMVGVRNGDVIFGDVRVKNSVTRMKHDSAVSGLRRMRNENLVLVNGLKGMAVYDLRYSRRAKAGKKKYSFAEMILKFDVPESMQQKRYGLGFDYDEELNVAASAATDFMSQHRVGLWDCGSGKPIEESPLAKMEFKELVTCLQMIDLRDHGQSAKSILTMSGGIVEEWHV